jgi:hypothetical protein
MKAGSQIQGESGRMGILLLRRVADVVDVQVLIRAIITVMLGIVYWLQRQNDSGVHSVGPLALIALGLTLERLLHLFLALELRHRVMRILLPPSYCRGQAHKRRYIIVLPAYCTEGRSKDVKNTVFRRVANLAQLLGAWPTRGVKHLEFNVKIGAAMGDISCARNILMLFPEKLRIRTDIMTDVQLMADIADGKGAAYEDAVLFLIGLFSNHVTNHLAAALTFQHQGRVSEVRAALAADPHTIMAFVPTDLHERALQGRSEVFIRAYEDGHSAAPFRVCVTPKAMQQQNRKLSDYVPTEMFLAKVPWIISIPGCKTVRVTAVLLAGLTERGTSAAGCYLAKHLLDLWDKRCGPRNRPLRDQYFVGAVRKMFNYEQQDFDGRRHASDLEHFATIDEKEFGVPVFLRSPPCKLCRHSLAHGHVLHKPRRCALGRKRHVSLAAAEMTPRIKLHGKRNGNGHLHGAGLLPRLFRRHR